MVLKLYVWEDVLCDYTYGIMFALAHNPEEAKELIIKKASNIDNVVRDLYNVPQEITKPEGFYIYGSS